MIIGIGIDLIEISRITKAADKAAFLHKVFTTNELTLYDARGKAASVLAGCFAGKEAVSKALGSGFRGFTPLDIEILRHENGRPYAVLQNGALELFTKLGGTKVHLSITNTRDYAEAFAVIDSDTNSCC